MLPTAMLARVRSLTLSVRVKIDMALPYAMSYVEDPDRVKLLEPEEYQALYSIGEFLDEHGVTRPRVNWQQEGF